MEVRNIWWKQVDMVDRENVPIIKNWLDCVGLKIIETLTIEQESCETVLGYSKCSTKN